MDVANDDLKSFTPCVHHGIRFAYGWHSVTHNCYY